jgi:DDE superfamily endonuclease
LFGRPGRDYEYDRNGTAYLSTMFAPLEGWRHIEITDRRTAIDYARAIEDLSDRHFPNAKKIVLVQDNLNTHKPASLYEAFPPDKARRAVRTFSIVCGCSARRSGVKANQTAGFVAPP